MYMWCIFVCIYIYIHIWCLVRLNMLKCTSNAYYALLCVYVFPRSIKICLFWNDHGDRLSVWNCDKVQRPLSPLLLKQLNSLFRWPHPGMAMRSMSIPWVWGVIIVYEILHEIIFNVGWYSNWCLDVLISLASSNLQPWCTAQQIPMALFHSQPASNQHLRCCTIQLPFRNAFWRPLCHQTFELHRDPLQATGFCLWDCCTTAG